MKHVQHFTHTAWFGLCPVYAADLDTDCPHLTPRVDNAFYEGLFAVSHHFFMVLFVMCDAVCWLLHLDYEPGFPIFVTSELLVPYRYEYEEDEDPLL